MIVYVVTSRMSLALISSILELLLSYCLNLLELIKSSLRGSVDVLGAVWLVFVLLIGPFSSTHTSCPFLIIEVVTRTGGSIIRVRHQ